MAKTIAGYDEFFEDAEPSTLQATVSAVAKTVPNAKPKIPPALSRIAIIGEAPGADEIKEGQPFVGYSGRELNKWLSHAGIVRDACLVGNVCQHRPPGNKIALFAWEGQEIQNGLVKLSEDLKEFRPNVIICLGALALHAFMAGRNHVLKKKKTAEGLQFLYPYGIGDWRGSFFISHMESPLPGVKCMAAYHPAACIRNFEWMPQLMLDIMKASKEAHRAELVLPERNIIVDTDVQNIVNNLRQVKETKPTIAIDIEGYVAVETPPGEEPRPYGMKCISIATGPHFSFIVPFAGRDNSNLYSIDDETYLWRALTDVLTDPGIPKVLQNSLYDRFVLQYSYNIVVRGVVDDTMLKHWELYCELEKSLGFQCSLYTMEPFYKAERTSEDLTTYWAYCCKDSAVTHEINGKLGKWLKGRSIEHYQFNMDLLNVLLYMENKGIRYDHELAKTRLAIVQAQVEELQYDLNEIAGVGFNFKMTKGEILNTMRSIMCKKSDRTTPKKEFIESYEKNEAVLLREGPLTKAELGRISIDCKVDLNIKGDKLKTYLYETLKLPPQYKGEGEGQRLTTDYEALLRLNQTTKHPAVDLAISIGSLRTRAQMLQIYPDTDGRIRAGYNAVGTETGRITCYTSPTGSGYNLQTIPSEDPLRPVGHPMRSGMRDMFVADVGYYLFQCDLSGADGWTVGAHLAALGERTMLDDLRAKIKPAQRIAYMLRHGNDSLRGRERGEIKELLKEVKKEDFDYFMCKCGIWGICYLMGVDRLRDLIFAQSEGRIAMSRADVANFRSAVYACYKPNKWHDSTKDRLSRQPYPPRMTAASGQTRMFFGRFNEILGEALANEPQQNTTYATNKAALRLWSDADNRTLSTERRVVLRIQPLHQVHDALVGQFRIEDTAWAIDKIKSYFNNPVNIAGLQITIPFGGQYGTNWAFDQNSQIGTFE